MKIAKIGVDDNYPEYLQRKVILSNQIALVVGLLVAAPFIFISLIHFPPIAYLPAVGTFVCLSTLAFNYFKLQIIARLVIALLPVMLCSIYAGYVNHAGETPVPALTMLALSFTLVIYLVFDIREKGYLITLSIIAMTILLLTDEINNVFEMDLDNSVIISGYLSRVTIAISVITGGASILILANQNKEAEEKSQELLAKSKETNEQLSGKEVELKENLEKIEAAQEDEKKRQWASEGIAESIKIMRDYQEMQQLYDDLISFIVKYLETNQGGLFVLNEDNTEDLFLELVSAYAYDRKKYIEKRVEIGEGLLGQTFLEGKYVLLKEIPENYINITSGLGKSNPRSLLIMPIKVNEKTLGLIELASFKEFEPHQIDFLETLGENIASTIDNVRSTSRMQALLEDSQQQTEEMRAQEEEMRQNQEELQATQEELARQKSEMEEEIAELKKALEDYEKTGMETQEAGDTGPVESQPVDTPAEQPAPARQADQASPSGTITKTDQSHPVQ